MKKMRCIIPTLAKNEKTNTFEHLKLAITSFQKYSSPDTTLRVHIDGYFKPTRDFLEEKGVGYSMGPWQGQTKAFNDLAKESEEDWIFLGHDDMFYPPKWDTKLLAWCEDPVLAVTPVYLEPHIKNFGRSPAEFDEEGFLRFVKEKSIHDSKPYCVGMQVINRKLFLDLGGYDEVFSPYGITDTDFIYRLIQERPEVKSIMAFDSFVYHFSRTAKKVMEKTKYGWEVIGKSRDEYFLRKHGIGQGEASNRIWKHFGVTHKDTWEFWRGLKG